MYSILLDIWLQVKSLKPAFLSRHPHFNFITIHYFWIMGMIILCSLCLYIRSDLEYIDALFFASGASTQSGLNTIDLNLLGTWQQVAILTTTMFTTPVTINTFVVFLRLFWFERRFQDVVKSVKSGRWQSVARTFSKSKSQGRDHNNEERGVGNRDIVVMHHTGSRSNGTATPNELQDGGVTQQQTRSSDESSRKDTSSGSTDEALKPTETGHTPQIKFADQVRRSNGLADEDLRLPGFRSQEEHIAVLNRQRAESTDILRIPGPRDADAGASPQMVNESDATLSRILSGAASTFASRRGSITSHVDDHLNEPVRRNVTIQEPEPRSHLAATATAASRTLSPLTYVRRRNNATVRSEKSEAEPEPERGRKRAGTFNSIKRVLSSSKPEFGTPYLSWEPTVGRNSEFVDLTEDQREELGGIEYRALKTLALILVLYNVGFTLFGVVSLVPWITTSNTYGVKVTEIGQGRPWWGIFTSISAFTDLGFTLTPDSMIQFQTAIWPLLLMSFLIIIGNTGFPIMLRIIIWVTSKYVPMFSELFEELRFLLDHPRRCFTLLFPSKATWWLFWILVTLNGLDLIFFIVLDLGNKTVDVLPTNIRILDGWFQAVSTRTAGFAAVNLAALHPAIQVSYLIMMYISILPIAISVRRTNVYEEKSLGIYGSSKEENEDESEPSYVGAHLRRQLSFDLWYIFMGFFIISIAEGPKITKSAEGGDFSGFTMFSVLFEIVSAYGTVGLSLGYPNTNASFSAQFGVVSKLVIIAMQIRGRHRGLPYALDRAILLPSEHLQKQEVETALLRRPTSEMGNAGVSEGAMKTADTRGRSRSNHRKASNLLGTLLQTGPALPNHIRIDPTVVRRRHSIAIAEGRGHMERTESTRVNMPEYGIGIGDGVVENGAPLGDRDAVRRSGSRYSGRRSFFVEGLNAPVPESSREN